MFIKEIHKNNFHNKLPQPAVFFSDILKTAATAASGKIYLASQPDILDGPEREILDQILDDIRVSRRGRNYTYRYAEIPAVWNNAEVPKPENIEVGDEAGSTFWRPTDEGDRLWYSYVRPEQIREQAPKLGLDVEEFKKLIALHELVHKNCAAMGIDRPTEEVYGWLAQALYRPQLILQASLFRAALATKQEIIGDQEFLIEAVRRAIAKTFKGPSPDMLLKAIEIARAEAKAANDRETDPRKKTTIPQLIDRVMWEAAKQLAARLGGDATEIYRGLYKSLQQNFVDEMAAYLP